MHTFALIFGCWAFASQGRRSSSTQSSTENVAKFPSSLRLELGSVRPSNSLRRLLLTLNYVLPLPGSRIAAGGSRSFPVATLQPSPEKRVGAHLGATPERGQPGYKRAVLKRVVRRIFQRDHTDATSTMIKPVDLADSTHFDSNRSSEDEQLDKPTEVELHSAAREVIANASSAEGAIGHNSSDESLGEIRIDAAMSKGENNFPEKADVASTSTTGMEKHSASTPLVAAEVAHDSEHVLDDSDRNLSLQTSKHSVEMDGNSTDAHAQFFSGETYGSQRRITFSEFGRLGQLPPLPSLSSNEERRLRSGEYVRWQEPSIRAGSRGFGFSVVELHANADDVWRAVRDFDGYREKISTVKTVTRHADMPAEKGGFPRYSFLVSRIRLALNVRFMVDDINQYAAWRLDKRSWVLCDSDGYWRVQPCEDRPGVVRVWFVVGVQLAKFVPNFVIQLVSRLGLDKATRWLKSLEVDSG